MNVVTFKASAYAARGQRSTGVQSSVDFSLVNRSLSVNDGQKGVNHQHISVLRARLTDGRHLDVALHKPQPSI